ncbi:MAG: efflux RND transporter periplasmic adaptor subunit [Deferribacteres bacterium]|nr:efflux RND transporter periplasmic adaptor subunit [candidate division KSB1 bacterium]MCB9503168.1 efflux RND transporter periplasmic adaptor subunit [Deferribacteres bacterium]
MKSFNEIINDKSTKIALGALFLGLALGWLFFGGNPPAETDHSSHIGETKDTIWTCSMHPQIRQKEPGKCPLCGMDLIPLSEGSSDEDPMEIKMSPTAMQLANVQTSIITKQKPVKSVRMNGKVQADERQVNSQTSHIAGRIEKLLVNYTGETIHKGQILAYIYSPQLVTAQEELFEAWKIRDSQPELFKAAKDKLKNWKLTPKQIDSILESGKPREDFPIAADMSGVVLAKRVKLGDHVMAGSSLFEVADLNKIWILFDVYESDIPWVKTGDEVEFTIQSLPGESFKGKISFIDPVINPKSRVAKARIEMKNPGQRLKPEMFAIGLVKSPLNGSEPTLIVPKSAVMWTGDRSVVYVKKTSASGIGFVLREVTLGPALGDSYVIKEGLNNGEEIATNGTFSIDAAAQLAGKPSMMNPQGGAMSTGHQHGDAKTSAKMDHSMPAQPVKLNKKAQQAVVGILDKYLDLKNVLTEDALDKAQKAAGDLQKYTGKINMSLFKGEAHNIWMQHSAPLENASRAISQAKDIGSARSQFIVLSDQLIMLAKSFGPFEKPLFVQFCPMANNDKGAEWLSANEEIRNPYFGESMLKCGEVRQSIK